MTNDLREAAERIISSASYEDQFDYDGDAHEVARGYLAEHPADSDTPLDEAWLRSVGFQKQDVDGDEAWTLPCRGNVDQKYSNTCFLVVWPADFLPNGKPGLSSGLWQQDSNFQATREWWPVDFSLRLATRRDVRRLVKALGIELREGV